MIESSEKRLPFFHLLWFILEKCTKVPGRWLLNEHRVINRSKLNYELHVVDINAEHEADWNDGISGYRFGLQKPSCMFFDLDNILVSLSK